MSSGSSAYRSAGVDYAALDAGKRNALTEALATSGLLERLGGQALDDSRGEPAFVFRLGQVTLGFVLEGLGTKSMIARQLEGSLGAAGFAAVAYDAVAAIVNDLVCVGALPLVVNAYFATGSSEWYQRPERQQALLLGWRQACEDAGATWGGGESPSLPDLVSQGDIELAGSAIGLIGGEREPILGQGLSDGDDIVIVASSGLHANGASLARSVAARLPAGYRTPLLSGRELGQALLDRSIIYSPLIGTLLDSGIEIHYLSHITGHGLLKLMRPRREFSYVIRELPDVPEVLTFLVEQAGLSPAAAYSTFNMGCGFAVYCASGAGRDVVRLAARQGLDARVAGQVREGPRQVVLEPISVTYRSQDLDLTPHR